MGWRSNSWSSPDTAYRTYWREGTRSVTGDVTGEIVSPAPPGKGGDVIRLELDTRSDAECQRLGVHYQGEMGRTAYCRGLDHLRGLRNRRPDNVLWKHVANVHGGDIDQQFEMNTQGGDRGQCQCQLVSLLTCQLVKLL